jgi:hypothetical protein
LALACECAAYSPQFQNRDYLRKNNGDVRIERFESPMFDVRKTPLYLVSLVQEFRCTAGVKFPMAAASKCASLYILSLVQGFRCYAGGKFPLALASECAV